MKIHANGYEPKSGDCFWAAAFPYNSKEPTIFPVTFTGEAPYLELKASGNYHSEWWLLERLELPAAEVLRTDNGEVICVKLATRDVSEQQHLRAIGAEQPQWSDA